MSEPAETITTPPESADSAPATEVTQEEPKVEVVVPDATAAPTAKPAASAEEPATISPPAPVPTTNATSVAPDPAAVAPFENAAEEPQNALTRKFTEGEWTALKTFRVCLYRFSALTSTDRGS